MHGGDECAVQVRARLRRDSYVLLRGVLPRERVLRACAAMCEALHAAGWMDADADPLARRARPDFARHELRMNGYSIGGPNVDSREIPDPKTKGQIYGGFHDLQNHPDIRAVLHADELFEVASALFGEPAGALDYRWMRAVLPNQLVGHGAWDPSTCLFLGLGFRALRVYMYLRGPDVTTCCNLCRVPHGQRIHGERFGSAAHLLAAFSRHRSGHGWSCRR
eukprot:COSAG02_NODE_1349_length_13132_cov_8.583289_8_plen_221_part_00